MIAYLKGILLTHTRDGAVLLCGSIGYEVIGSWLSRITPGTEVESWIYEYLENENIPRMVSCQTLEARSLFLQLLSVQGVGPKMASRIIDAMDAGKLITAISSGDVDTLSTVKGLGKKTAQKIILELGKILVTDVGTVNAGIFDALSTLKFTPREIQTAIDSTDLDGLSENERLSAVLKTLGGRR